jgi:hypothetical protein
MKTSDRIPSKAFIIAICFGIILSFLPFEFEVESAGGKVFLPSIHKFPDIKNQGHRGTCATFATVAFMEYEFNNYPIGNSKLEPGEKNSEEGVVLSEQYFAWALYKKHHFYQGARFEVHEGSWLSRTMEIAQEEGTCRDEAWEYTSNLEKKKIVIPAIPFVGIEAEIEYPIGPPPPDAIDEAKTFTYKPIIHREFKPNLFNAIIRSLTPNSGPTGDENGHIIPFAIPIFEWEDPETGEAKMSYNYSLGKFYLPEGISKETLKNSIHRAHAMDLVGYDEGQGVFYLRNSWGTDFGSGFSLTYEAESTSFSDLLSEMFGGKKKTKPTGFPGYGMITYDYIKDWCSEVLFSAYWPQHTFDFDPELEETSILPPGEYPVCGDWWVDKQVDEMENQTTAA